MQFLRKVGRIIGWRPCPPLGNPGTPSRNSTLFFQITENKDFRRVKEQNLTSDVVAKASHLTLGYYGFLGLDADGYELFKLSKERGRSSLPDRGKLTYEEHNIT